MKLFKALLLVCVCVVPVRADLMSMIAASEASDASSAAKKSEKVQLEIKKALDENTRLLQKLSKDLEKLIAKMEADK